MAISNKPQHLEFPTCTILFAQMLGQAGCHLWWNVPSAGMDRSNDGEQFIFRHALKDVGCGSCAQRTLDLTIAVRCAQHDDSSLGKLSTNCYECVCAVGTWKARIHQRDVWPMTAEFSHCLDRISRLRNQQHVLLRPDDRAQSFTKDGMILYTQDANRLRVNHCHCLISTIICSPVPSQKVDLPIRYSLDFRHLSS